MHVFLQVPLSWESRQHEHVVRHRVGQLMGTPGDVARSTNFETIQQTIGVGAECHDIEVLAGNRGGL